MNQRVDPKLLTLGIDSMDRDHKRLIDIANMVAAIVEAPNFRERSLAPELRALKHYTEEHFAREEAFMAEIRYPGLGTHKEQHRQMVAELDRISENGKLVKGAKFALQLRLFMQVWLFEHISKHDAEYAVFAKAKGLA